MTPAGAVYAHALAGAALHARIGAARVQLPVDRWCGTATAADELALGWAAGPVLDVGCGPGRHLAALARRGVPALGIDPSPAARAAARARGVIAVRGSVFGPVPAAGEWRTALLLDGNLGIGGAPARLLRRVAGLLLRGGAIVVELDPPGTGVRRARVRLESADVCSAPFPWAFVGADAIDGLAARTGLVVTDRLAAGGRRFSRLETA
jgi:SAM-dependent methyltransferase